MPTSGISRIAVGALIVVGAGCFQPVGPARTFHDYELKAESTAKSARKERMGISRAQCATLP